MASDYCREVVVLGTVGAGKSSLCNSLLDRKAFEVTPFPFGTVTHEVEKKSSMYIVVTDTPGLLDTEKSVAEIAFKILSDRNGCPYPHAFLIVFDATNRIRKDCHRIMNLLRIMFGETCFAHAIVVFTMVNDKITDNEFLSFWKQNEEIQQLVEACGRRIVRIDNQGDERLIREQGIIQLVDKLSDNGKKRFDLPLRSIHVKVLRNYRAKHGAGESCNTTDGQQNTNELYDADVKQMADDLAKEYDRFSKEEAHLRILIIMVVFLCALVVTGVCLLLFGKTVGFAFYTIGFFGMMALFFTPPAEIMQTAVCIEKVVRLVILKFKEICPELTYDQKEELLFLFRFYMFVLLFFPLLLLEPCSIWLKTVLESVERHFITTTRY